MILATSILFFALFSPVELFKFHHKAPEEPNGELQAQRLYQSGLYLGAPRYYPLPADFLQAPLQQQQQQHQFQQAQFEQQLPLNEPQLHQSTKGAELKAAKGQLEQRPQLTQESYLQQVPYVQQQPASIAYLVVRPIQPAPLLPATIAQPQLPAAQNLREQFKQEQQPAGIKGGRQTDFQADQIEQQRQIDDPQPLQPALVVPVPAGKEGKFKALLDRLMSKLTLGSSYQVTHEEIEQAPAPTQRQPAPQQQIIQQQQQPIEQQQEQKVEQLEDQRLEQQLEQQRDNFFDEGLKQTKGHQEQQFQQQQQQQQIREEQLQQQNLAQQELQKQRDQQAFKGQQQPLQQEPIRQELEPVRQEPIKGKRLLADRLAGQQQIQQQQQQQVQQESLRQEAKGNAGF